MKKLLYVLFALLTLTSAAQAQTAKQILDQTAAKLKKSGGLQATFKVGNFTRVAVCKPRSKSATSPTAKKLAAEAAPFTSKATGSTSTHPR